MFSIVLLQLCSYRKLLVMIVFYIHICNFYQQGYKCSRLQTCDVKMQDNDFESSAKTEK